MKKPSTTNQERPVLFHPAGQFTFARVPVWVLAHPDLSLGAKLLFGRLLGHAGERDHAFPSQQHLAETFDVSKRTISGWVRELKDAELVHVTRRRDTSAIYRFPVNAWPDGTLNDREAAISKAKQLATLESQEASGPDQHETADRRDHLEEITTEEDSLQIEHYNSNVDVDHLTSSTDSQEEVLDTSDKQETSPTPLAFSSYGKRIATMLETEFDTKIGEHYLEALGKLEQLELDENVIREEVAEFVRRDRRFPTPVHFSSLFVAYEVQRILSDVSLN